MIEETGKNRGLIGQREGILLDVTPEVYHAVALLFFRWLKSPRAITAHVPQRVRNMG
jgi:hypothetical protein